MLPDAHGSMVDLRQFKGRNVILVFFKGIRCGYCVQDLRAIVRESRARSSDKVEIVAVSDRKVDDLPKALKLLGVTEADKFHLLIDEARKSFRISAAEAGSTRATDYSWFDARGPFDRGTSVKPRSATAMKSFDRLRLIAGLARDRARTVDNVLPKLSTAPKVIVESAPAAPAIPIGGGSFDD